ncbi:glycosyltransferase family 2 protein [Candidatus Micrarchaeota archaeon]|nr:glycosyltransferase family 2 protein [Candidatus Micrarchaeota archaeon]
MTPRVSMLIITLNELPALKEVIRDLRKQTLKEFEIIVCDNGSEDGTEAFVKTLKGVKYVNSGKNIGTPVFNSGLALSEADFIFIGATDMKFPPDCLKKTISYMDAHPDCGQAFPIMLKGQDHSIVDVSNAWLSRGFYAGSIKELPTKNERMPFVGGGMVRRKALNEAGGFLYEPTYFIYGEDVDLGYRLRRAGYYIEAINDTFHYHYGHQAKKIFTAYQLTRMVEKNMWNAMLCHLRKRDLLFSIPYAWFLRGLVFLKDLLKGDFGRAKARISGVFYTITHLPAILERRKRLAKILKNQWIPEYFTNSFYDESFVLSIFLNMIKRSKK